MRVMKFGGSSLANWQRFSKIAEIIAVAAEKEQVACVLSAPATVTNTLIETVELAIKGHNFELLLTNIEQIFIRLHSQAAEEKISDTQLSILNSELIAHLSDWRQKLAGVKLLNECPDSVQAQIISSGEKLSANLLEQILIAKGITSSQLDPQELFLAHGAPLEAVVDINLSKPKFKTISLNNNRVWVMPGFSAADSEGKIVTLGRNGSDYSATVLAACINASSCDIWTDVDGVYNTDPRVVPDAKLLTQLSYQEAMELSYFGAKVLHPKTIAPIAQYHIPCYIRNSFNPDSLGTLVSNDTDTTGLNVKAISNLDEQCMFDVSGPGMKGMVGMASRMLGAISQTGVSVSLITQSSSEYSMSFCVATLSAAKVKAALEQEFELELKSELLEAIKVRKNLAIVSLIGDGMRTRKGVAAQFFKALAQASVNIIAIAQGSSERSISTVIEQSKTKNAISACHQSFFDVQHYLDVFLVGCGNVGTGLLEQINKQAQMLKAQNITVRVCGIANSTKMLLNAEGIELSKWPLLLNESQQISNIPEILNWICDQQLLNPVLVDCTSSSKIAEQYVDVLEAGLHVVTPNKKANTRDLAYYQQLRQVALKQKRQFLYETTVGAGLPVIDNLKKLLCAGDKLLQFNGILSGSLSYIFGMLDEGMRLSQATSIAREKCFTEPDPRDDLSGMDVARKVLILAREVGLTLELDDVDIESVLPEGFDSSGSIDEFMENLTQVDEAFMQRISRAKANNKLLRYVGQINQGKCSVNIVEVDSSDPLYSVKGGENALAFYSQYYQPIPFVLRGYGAGTDVTAAGTFSDLLRTLNWTRELDS
ncbi:bifunctional aspartate kinase/homoserine dehydrogenase I [Parashewanella spongiae]|uniref:Bifunctional aspartokinase/homoserine dehydrogenase n=1 Tax=Parashewanella spongiae TaxID=342950 RepID=A0A3A6U834_9GAMM|nr:bifunctional aspartate kinase/homoserine dehydrogenase I [Parashewanella spongiae]MCL1077722.1 bifunctional aspartate kinase/homoserine dehydrogenase I [Parashewanella spongiae]RJY18076.1 bifunctional aspartate kinase/homoserine dehydrogenase I [Parashewanella spongiae]